jgi:hypothetical protein
MTGRSTGHCAGFTAPGFSNPVGFAGGCGRGFGRGFGSGFGRGRGNRRMFCATGIPGWERYGYGANTGANPAAFDEKAFLSNQAEYLENQLQQVKKRLSNLNEEAE